MEHGELTKHVDLDSIVIQQETLSTVQPQIQTQPQHLQLSRPLQRFQQPQQLQRSQQYQRLEVNLQQLEVNLQRLELVLLVLLALLDTKNAQELIPTKHAVMEVCGPLIKNVQLVFLVIQVKQQTTSIAINN